MPKLNKIDIWVIGGGLHYFISFRVQMNQIRFEADFNNKLSYIDIFNMIRKSRSYDNFIKVVFGLQKVMPNARITQQTRTDILKTVKQ